MRFRESVAEQIHDLHLLSNMSIVLRAVEANASGRKGEGHAAGHAKRRRRSGGASMAVFLDLIRARDPSGGDTEVKEKFVGFAATRRALPGLC